MALDNYCILAHSTRSEFIQLHCVDAVYTEATVSLCRLRAVEDNTNYTEILEVAQPVMELLVYSQLAQKSKKPKVLFFANS